MIEPGLVEREPAERELAEREPVQPAPSDSAVADLEQSGWWLAPQDCALPDFGAAVIGAAALRRLVSGMPLPHAGMLLQSKEGKIAEPEHDYSVGA